MAQQETKDNLKSKIVAFVNQCTTDGPNPVSFNEYSKNNPDSKQLDSKEALQVAIALVKENKLKLVEEEDSIQEFMVHKFEQAVDQSNASLMIEEYSRFLARADILGASYQVQNGTLLGALNLPQIDKISNFIDLLGFEKRTEFLNQFNTYIVRFYWAFLVCNQRFLFSSKFLRFVDFAFGKPGLTNKNFEKIRITELINYTNTISSAMAEENQD